ncbi:hypothetical protein LguiA_004805 [Lonicera macranthoides]
MASLEGVISLGPWGGLGGDHWRFRASNGITEIVLRVEGIIKSISFKNASGLFSGTFGARGNKRKTRGSRKKIEIDWPSEYLKSISGTYGSYKGQLEIAMWLDSMGDVVTTLMHLTKSQGSISLGQWGGPGININSLSFKDGNDQEYGKFGGNNPKDPSQERKIVIDGHLEHLTSITGTYGDCNGLLVITSLSFKTNLTTYGPFGTATGTSFSIPIEGSVVIGFHGRGSCYLDAIGIHVKPIVLYVGLNIKSISFRDTTDLDSATFGGKNRNDIGEKKTVLINWPSEHLISISGKYGNFASMITITSLSFTTNRATYGPFGTGSGTSFSIPINNNTVVGFHGRGGHYIDAIGIFVKPKTTI